MSGYLQRLAASVGLRPSRIRPVVDPLYAGGPGRLGVETAQGEFPLEKDSVLVASRARPEPAAPRLVRGERDGPLDDAERSAGAPAVGRPPVRREQNPAGSAIERPRADSPLTPGNLVPGTPGADFGGAPPKPVVARSADGAEQAPRGFEFRAVASFGAKEDRAPPLVRRPAAWPVAERDATETNRRSARDRAQKTAPDEIRINIGRVEVVAAAPAQPSAPPPARKAMSLEDYLRGASARRR